MATYGLTELNKVMKTQWGYGDILFVSEIEEVNFKKHNITYPLCVVVFPDSAMPNILEGWEDYEFEVYFCMLWKKVNRQTGPIQQKYDNIQYIANEWLDNVLDFYNHEDLILDPMTLDIERIKNFGNDKTLCIKFSFTLQAFRTCFNPKQIYPNMLGPGYNLTAGTGTLDYIKDADNNTVYTVEMVNTAWWRFDGWKMTKLSDTKRYVTQLNDMSKSEFKNTHQMRVVNFTQANNYDRTCELRSDSEDTNYDSGDANARFFGDTLNGVKPTTANGLISKVYMQGVPILSDPEQAVSGIFSGTTWSIVLVFELGDSDTADNETYLYNGGAGQVMANGASTIAGATFNISLNNGNLIVETRDYSDTGVSTSLSLTTLFGTDCFTRNDRTVAIALSYDAKLLLQYTTPWFTTTQAVPHIMAQYTPIGGQTTDNIWNLNKQYFLGVDDGATVTDYEKGFRNRVYEIQTYNWQVNMSHGAVTKNNPADTDGQWLINELAKKYNINQ